MKGRSLFHCEVVYKQCRALLWDLLFHLRAPVRQVSPGGRCSPRALAEEHGIAAGGTIPGTTAGQRSLRLFLPQSHMSLPVVLN